jgi:hypothetical protein
MFRCRNECEIIKAIENIKGEYWISEVVKFLKCTWDKAKDYINSCKNTREKFKKKTGLDYSIYIKTYEYQEDFDEYLDSDEYWDSPEGRLQSRADAEYYNTFYADNT